MIHMEDYGPVNALYRRRRNLTVNEFVCSPIGVHRDDGRTDTHIFALGSRITAISRFIILSLMCDTYITRDDMVAW